MNRTKAFAVVAACAAMACAGLARASELPSQEQLSLKSPIYAATEDRSALMSVLDQAGAGSSLDQARLTVGGWIEMSWTKNFDDPAGDINAGRVFDFEHDDHTFNQAVIFIDRSVTASSDKFDIGGRMEWMWGGDARLIHSNGLFDYDGVNDGPDEQFDLTQLYVTANLPVGNGLLVKFGKWVTLLGYETIAPLGNPLYSHSYLFGFAIPFTHTGVLGTYQIDKNVSASFGLVRGWDQALEDNNGDAISYIGQIMWTSDNLDIIINGITGPEQNGSDSDYRSVLDLVGIYRHDDHWTFVGNFDYGYESDAALDGDDAQWWGAAGYATYKVNDMISATGRIEYFDDSDGARGLNTEVIEATAGLTIRPMPNHQYGKGLVIRPEIRYDWASDEIFDGGQDDTQVTIGGDVIFAF